MRFALCSMLIAWMLAGCTIRPLPENVTGGVGTPDIVRRVRCETRQAAINTIVNWLELLSVTYKDKPELKIAGELAARYRNDPNAISEFGADIFKGSNLEQVRNTVRVIYSIGVAYNFDLTMTENNDFSAGSANLQQTSSNTLFKLGVGGAITRQRANNRTFTITDTFEYLLTKMNARVRSDGRRDCTDSLVAENHVYPIVGNIGVGKLIYDFLDLTIFDNLGGTKDKPAGPPTMADQLTFTTGLDASATPKVTFTPTGTAFQLTDVGITAEAKRTDVHQVTIGLAIPPEASAYLNSLRTFEISPSVRPETTWPQPRFVAKSRFRSYVGARILGGGNSAELLALQAVDQLKSRQIQFIPSP